MDGEEIKKRVEGKNEERESMSPEDEVRRNRESVRREFKELEKSRERSDRIQKDWAEL